VDGVCPTGAWPSPFVLVFVHFAEFGQTCQYTVTTVLTPKPNQIQDCQYIRNIYVKSQGMFIEIVGFDQE